MFDNMDILATEFKKTAWDAKRLSKKNVEFRFVTHLQVRIESEKHSNDD